MPVEKADEAVYCVRNLVAKPPEEHLECPYCFGLRAQILCGNRSDFCDFDPGSDPVSFGFPEQASRFDKG